MKVEINEASVVDLSVSTLLVNKVDQLLQVGIFQAIQSRDQLLGLVLRVRGQVPCKHEVLLAHSRVVYLLAIKITKY